MALPKGSIMVKEPDHNETDTPLSCCLFLSGGRVLKMNFKLPLLEGNVPEHKQNERDISEILVRALRKEFGSRVDVL